jgi:hypothetical protein
MHRKFNAKQKATPQNMRIKAKQNSRHSFLYNFLTGFANIFPSHSRGYRHPTGGGFYADSLAMQNDFGNVAKDMRKALRKYEQAETNKG